MKIKITNAKLLFTIWVCYLEINKGQIVEKIDDKGKIVNLY